MVQALIDYEGPEYSLRMKGHATGSDVICAACSAIAYSLAGYLQNRTGIHYSAYEVSSGEVNIAVQGGPILQEVFTMAYIGLAQIAAQYPEYVSIEKTFIS